MRGPSALLLSAILLPCAAAAAPPATLPPAVTGELRLAGAVRLEGTVEVSPTGVLVLEAGASVTAAEASRLNVHGRLEVRGTERQPVVLQPESGAWGGITLYDGSSALFQNAEVRGAGEGLSLLGARAEVRQSAFRDVQTAIRLVREASCTVEESLFARCRAGVVVEMKSEASVRRCAFEEGGAGVAVASGGLATVRDSRFTACEVGVHVQQRLPRPISGNLFERNGVGIRLTQNGPDTVVERNLFVGQREAGVAAVNFASPTIVNNRFEGGGRGVMAVQYSSPNVRGNAFDGCQEALHLDKKSLPRVVGNVISRSEVGVFLDFSSYPLVRDNVLEGNRTHVRLGRYQSSHWEVEAGSRNYVLQTAASLGSRNPRLEQGAPSVPEAVDLTGNWWDETTRREMDEGGADANLSTIHDGHDEPLVTYEGFGEARYRLDKVTFAPRLTAPPSVAGLQGWEGRAGDLAVP